MKVRYSSDPVRFCRMTTREVRESFLIESLYQPNAVEMLYADVDRAIVGSAVPAGTPLALTAADELRDSQVQATLGFCFSPNLQGEYRVVLDTPPADLANVLIKATPLAEQAYASAPYQMILYIYDEDRQATEVIRRPVVLSFPEEYVRRDEIQPDQSPPEARFRLVPIPKVEEEAPGS